MFGLTDAVGRATLRAASYAAVCLLAVCAGTAGARAETRSLKIYNLHTHEKEDIAYKRNGRYLPDGLKKVNWILRDWRKQQPINMDPRLLDLIWEAYRQSGSRAYINVVCGYRSPGTNSMLRSRSSGVAKESQHTLGKAMDFYLPDVSLAKLRAVGLKMQVGGVGYYPRSGSPFVHFDVGNVRHWPRMSRKELLAVFPNGNTVHVPSDGKPLPGYEQALASYKSRKSASSIQVANAGAAAPSSSSGGGKTLLAMLFGGGADEEEDNADADAPKTAPAKTARPEATEAAKPAKADPAPAIDAVKPAKEPVAVAALAPAPKRDVLPNGVPLPIRDTFDTSARKTMVPPADLTGGRSNVPAVDVAALDMSRIPLPSAAPVRETALVAEALKVPVPSQPAEASRPNGEALLAALQTPPAADAAAEEPEQLAYSVPTPRNRPPFASILKQAAPAPETIDEIKAIMETANAEAPVASAPRASTTPSLVQTAMPAAGRTLADPRPKTDTLLLASLEAPKSAASSSIARKLVVPAGKTARFARRTLHKTPGASTPAAASIVPTDQRAIGERIRMADLVTDPNKRSEVTSMVKPNAATLAHDLPTSVMVAGFASGPLAPSATGFAGSAVHFMPVVKLD